MEDRDSWRTHFLRQAVVSKFEQVIRESGRNSRHTPLEMEKLTFEHSQSKEEYLGYVAQMILHFREMLPGELVLPGPPSVPDLTDALGGLAIEENQQPSLPSLMATHAPNQMVMELRGETSNDQMAIRNGPWRSPAHRQLVISKIDEAVRQPGMNTSQDMFEMENHAFQISESKEQYLGYVARIILHIRDVKLTNNSKKKFYFLNYGM